jgi:hypothetical protein
VLQYESPKFKNRQPSSLNTLRTSLNTSTSRAT